MCDFIIYVTVPGHVTNLSLKPDQYSIIVNWNKPLADAECVASYIIQYKSTASNDFIVGNTMDLSYKIINLKACTDYEIQVFARNEDYNDSVLMSGQNRTLTAGKKNFSGGFMRIQIAYTCIHVHRIRFEFSVSDLIVTLLTVIQSKGRKLGVTSEMWGGCFSQFCSYYCIHARNIYYHTWSESSAEVSETNYL